LITSNQATFFFKLLCFLHSWCKWMGVSLNKNNIDYSNITEISEGEVPCKIVYLKTTSFCLTNQLMLIVATIFTNHKTIWILYHITHMERRSIWRRLDRWIVIHSRKKNQFPKDNDVISITYHTDLTFHRGRKTQTARRCLIACTTITYLQ
jgi:hypothetical protein